MNIHLLSCAIISDISQLDWMDDDHSKSNTVKRM